MRKIQPDVRTVPRISSTKLHFLNYGVYKLVTYTHTYKYTQAIASLSSIDSFCLGEGLKD